MDYLGKGKVLTNTDLDKFVNKIRDTNVNGTEALSLNWRDISSMAGKVLIG